LKFIGILENIRLGTKCPKFYLQSWPYDLKWNQFRPLVLVGLGFFKPSSKHELAKVSDGDGDIWSHNKLERKKEGLFSKTMMPHQRLWCGCEW
jgi:hypothetical protein